MKKFKVGKCLANGAFLIALFGDREWESSAESRYCLVLSEKGEYVTWLVDVDGNTLNGHYFQSFFSAVDDFKERTKNQVQIG